MSRLSVAALGTLGLGVLLGLGPSASAQGADSGAFRAPQRTRAEEEDARRLLRNQTEIRAALDDLRTDVQVTQAKVDELSKQFAGVLKELEALRATLAASAAASAKPAGPPPEPFPTLARPRQPDRARGGRTAAAPPEPARGGPERGRAPASSENLAFHPRRFEPAPPPVGREPAAPVPPSPAVPPAPVAAAPAEDVSEEAQFAVYEGALNDYHAQNYGLARDGFAEFLRRFPTSTYANNAQFYTGQCYYAEGKYAEAVAAYERVVQKYPGGAKVPSALLKIGYAREKLGQKPEAKVAFQQVIDTYPFSSEAQLARNRLQRL